MPIGSTIHSSVRRGPMRLVTEVSETYPDRIINVVHLSLSCGHTETVYVSKGHQIKPRWISCEACGNNSQK